MPAINRAHASSRKPHGYLHLHVVDEQHPLGDVKTVQQPLVRLALLVRQVGLEALLRLEGHDVDLCERIARSPSSFEATAMTLKQGQNC